MPPAVQHSAAPARGKLRVIAESVALALVGVGAVVGPVLVGGTGPWARLLLATIMGLAACLWLVSARRPWWLAAMPLAVTALVGLQLIPLPDRLLVALAPISGGAWKVALAAQPGAWGTISVDPGLTAISARWLFLSLLAGGMVASLATHPAYRRWLIGALSVSAIVIWSLVLLFPATGHRDLLGRWSLRGPIEWFRTSLKQPVETHAAGEWVQVEAGGQRYEIVEWGVGEGWGSYVLSNHVACGLYLTVPLLAAAWLSATRSRLPLWLRVAVAAGLLSGLVATNVWVGSRAGSAAALIAVFVFAGIACEGAVLRRVAIGLAGLCVVGMLGLAFMLYGPFSHIEQIFPAAWQPRVERLLHDGRVEIAKATFRIFSASPILGTGLGTFGELSARLIPGREAFYYAHNDYGQLLAEAGLLGGLVACVGTFFGCRRLWRGLAQASSADRMLMAGPLAALAALAIHSLFDWNLHIPANAFLAMMVGGLAIGMMPVLRQPQAAVAQRPGRGSAIVGVVAAAAAMGAVVLCARDTWSELAVRQLRDAIAAAQLVKKNPESAPLVAERLKAAISASERAAAWDPLNAEIPRQVALAHVHLSRSPDDEEAKASRRSAERCATLRAAGRPGPEPLLPKPSR